MLSDKKRIPIEVALVPEKETGEMPQAFRVLNSRGAAYTIIEVGGYEAKSIFTEDEQEMFDTWNKQNKKGDN
jgi:hypothetical protein